MWSSESMTKSEGEVGSRRVARMVQSLVWKVERLEGRMANRDVTGEVVGGVD